MITVTTHEEQAIVMDALREFEAVMDRYLNPDTVSRYWTNTVDPSPAFTASVTGFGGDSVSKAERRVKELQWAIDKTKAIQAMIAAGVEIKP